MLNSKLKIVSSVLSISILVGCGSSGGDGGSSDSNGSTTVTKPVIEVSGGNTDNSGEATNSLLENIAAAEMKMSELQVAPDFSFTNKNQVTVSVDLQTLLETNNKTGERAYLSIYRHYSLLPSGKFFPDSSSRVLAGDLLDGLFNQSFVSLNNQSTYLIEVWFYNGEQPIQKEQQVVASNLTW